MEQNHFQQLKVVGPEIGSIGISAKPNQAILLLMLANNADQRGFFL
jgi:Na+-transporting methylmalonyl-CoA/oxaloacetate decarboxylase beta subunit